MMSDLDPSSFVIASFLICLSGMEATTNVSIQETRSIIWNI